jgi:hypothetical protein
LLVTTQNMPPSVLGFDGRIQRNFRKDSGTDG